MVKIDFFSKDSCPRLAAYVACHHRDNSSQYLANFKSFITCRTRATGDSECTVPTLEIETGFFRSETRTERRMLQECCHLVSAANGFGHEGANDGRRRGCWRGMLELDDCWSSWSSWSFVFVTTTKHFMFHYLLSLFY